MSRFSRAPIRAIRAADATIKGCEPLVAAAQGGSRTARDAVILRFFPWIQVQARLYAKRCGRHDLIEDMQQAAVCGEDKSVGGIMRAIEKYDPEKGAPFDTYAIYWVNKELLQFIGKHSNSALSTKQMIHVLRIKNIAGDLQTFLHREPSIAEIRAAWGPTGATYSDDYITNALNTPRELEFCDLHVRSDASHAPARAALVDEGGHAERSADARKLLSELTPRQQLVLTLYFGEGMTDAEIGTQLGVTPQRVQQIRVNTIESLGHSC